MYVKCINHDYSHAYQIHDDGQCMQNSLTRTFAKVLNIYSPGQGSRYAKFINQDNSQCMLNSLRQPEGHFFFFGGGGYKIIAQCIEVTFDLGHVKVIWSHTQNLHISPKWHFKMQLQVQITSEILQSYPKIFISMVSTKYSFGLFEISQI